MDAGFNELMIPPNPFDHTCSKKIEAFFSVLVTTLNALESAIRQLHPPTLPELSHALEPFSRRFSDAKHIFFENPFPKQVHPLISQIKNAAGNTQTALDGLINAWNSPDYI